MKNVEMVRELVKRTMDFSVKRFRIQISTLDGNATEVDLLRQTHTELMAKIIEIVMEHLGHSTKIRGEAPDGYAAMSKARRVAAKV